MRRDSGRVRVAGERVTRTAARAFFCSAGETISGLGWPSPRRLIAVVEAADFFDGGFGLVAVQQVEGDERVFKLGQGRAGGDGVLAEALEGGGADGEDAVEFVGGVGAVVPEMGVGVRAAEGARVFVGDVDEAGLLGGCRGWR